MPTIPANQLVDGVAEHPDFLVFLVESRTEGVLPHRVDLQRYNANGFCDCDNFKYKMNPALADGAMPQPALECWHIKQAKRYLLFKVLNAVVEEREKQAEKNKQ